jgi:hypothetical protein
MTPMNKMLVVAAAAFFAGIAVGRADCGGGPDPFAEGSASTSTRVTFEESNGHSNCWMTDASDRVHLARFCETPDVLAGTLISETERDGGK